MTITNKTTIGEAALFMKKEHFEQLLEQCEPVRLEKPIISMTVGEFIEACDDDYIMRFFQDKGQLLVVAIGKVKQFNKEMENISKLFKLNETKPTNDELTAQKGVVFPTFQETMLCECLEWFHLHSLDDAEKIPLSNYLIVKRKKTAEARYERNLNKLYADKNNKPKGNK